MALLNLNEQATSRLPLEPIKKTDGMGYIYNGCIPATIIEVKKVTQKHEKGEFAGMEVPALAIEFTNYKLNVNDPDRFSTHYVKVVGSKQLQVGTSDQYMDREAKDIIADNTEMWKLVKHFLDSLVGSPNFRNIADIPKKDITEYFDLPDHGTAENRAKAYDKFFTYIANFVNGDGNEKKSMILDANNQPLHIWVKMLANYDKDPKRNAKYYAIPRFIGSGVFEPLKVDGTTKLPIAPRIIKVKPTENIELIATPQSANKANVSGNNSNAGASSFGGQTIPADVNEILKAAGGGNY